MSRALKSLAAALVLAAGLASPVLAQDPVRNVVLVHGAFADETSWDAVAGILTARGYTVTQVPNPLTSLEDDVAATRQALDAQTGPVVLVAHSWGGVVIGEAGDDPDVRSLVYVSAFAPDRGESVAALSAGGPPSPGVQAIRPAEGGGGLIIDPAQFHAVFAADLDPAVAAEMARIQLPSNPANLEAAAVVAAWHDRPTWYVVMTQDLVIPPDAQRFFAGRMGATTTELDASHSGLISQAEAVADVIEAAAQ